MKSCAYSSKWSYTPKIVPKHIKIYIYQVMDHTFFFLDLAPKRIGHPRAIPVSSFYNGFRLEVSVIRHGYLSRKKKYIL